MNFLSKKDTNEFNNFVNKGYLIRKAENKKSSDYVINTFVNVISKILKKKTINLNYLHKYLSISDLNEFRMELYYKVNSDKNIRLHYFKIGRDSLFNIVGNELMMQNKLNISIQLPNDDTSLLPIHSDAWQGNSPYEANLWVPLVNCYRTKSMFILDGKYRYNYFKNKKEFSKSSGKIYELLKKKLIWLKINKGQFLLFDQTLPHGNIINVEKQTRISVNCRFKSIFSPYDNKKIAEYFSPISLRAMTEIANKFETPFLNEKTKRI